MRVILPPVKPSDTPLWKRLAIGPGIVFVLGSVGPQDLVVNATAGASHGYGLLWTLALIVLARYVVVEASARYVVATGETLMSGYARAGLWVAWTILIAILLKRHLTNLYHILLLGSGIELLIPLPTGNGRMVWAVLSCGFGFGVMYWGKYKAVENISKPLGVLLGGSFFLVGVFSKPDLSAVARGALVPSIPEGYGAYSYALVLLALIGAEAGGMGNLKYAAYTHEKGWNRPAFLRAQRTDLLLSAGAMYLVIVSVQVAAAATLYPSGADITQVEDLVPIFAAAFGPVGRVVLGIGLWSLVFSSYIGANTGYALLVSDIYYNVLRRAHDAPPETRTDHHASRPAYRWALVWFCISPLYVFWTDWQPFPLVTLTAVLMALMLPVTVSVLLWLTASRKRMGTMANRWFVNIVMICLIAATLYLAWQNAVGLL